MIYSTNTALLDRFPEERKEYEEYTKRITADKILLAKEKLNELDIQILQTIRKLGICNSTQIIRMFFNKEKEKTAITYCSRRIKKLYNLGCIDRFFVAISKGTSPVHVVLSHIGAKILNIDKFNKIENLGQNWRHTVAKSEFYSLMSLRYYMLGWWNEPKIEILKKERTFSLKPDLFISWQSKTINSAYVEIDLSTENYDTLFKKVENYNLAFETRAYLNENSYKHHKGVIPKVMFVFDNEQRLLKFNDGIKPSENGPKYTLITFDKISQIKKS